MKLFYLVSDPLPESLSVNKRVAAKFIERLRQLVPGVEIVEIDLNRDPPPFYDHSLFRYLWQPYADAEYQPSPDEHQAATYMLRQTQLLREADLVLQAAPVWNYYVPAILKAWIDQVVSPGQLYEFGANGKVPRHSIQALISIVSAGGWLSRDDTAQSLIRLLRAPYQYAGIERCHEVLVEAQEGALFADHESREIAAVEAAQALASRLAADITVFRAD